MKKILAQYKNPAFLICVAILLLSAGGMSFIEYQFQILFTKEHIPPLKPLEELDESKLWPFEIIAKSKIETEDEVKSLGTQDYIQWTVADTNALAGSPAGKFLLFITYYGKADSVPHVPEECYTGGGYQKDSSASQSIVFDVNDPNQGINKIVPGQYVVFKRKKAYFWEPDIQFPVLYFFNVNCNYTNTRTGARKGLAGNFLGKHSYFSKVEIVFNRSSKPPSKDQAVRACEKLLEKLLPVLEKEHWPDSDMLMGRR